MLRRARSPNQGLRRRRPHSYGGSEAVTFVAQFPTETAGVVLVDASPVTRDATTRAAPDDGSAGAQAVRSATCTKVTSASDTVERLDRLTAFADVATIDTFVTRR